MFLKLEWKNTPLFLAPMAGITDLPFRILCKELGAEVLITEMVSTRGIFYGDKKTERLLEMDQREHPIGLQLFGNEEEFFAYAVKKVENYPYDFININMGCPTPKIVKNGDGCALMRDPALASGIIRSAVEATGKPVTVKIRKGWDDHQVNAVEFSARAEESGAAALAVHGRTREQFYSGKADWEVIKRIKDSVAIPVIGNGDVRSPEDAVAMKEATGCDGIMIGRGALGDPWIFQEIRHYMDTGEKLPPPSLGARFKVILRHLDMALAFHGERLGMLEMRKHLVWYLKGLPHSSQVKESLQRCLDPKQVREILGNYFTGLDIYE
jgi:tRNA-dihydrouridine synthase B